MLFPAYIQGLMLSQQNDVIRFLHSSMVVIGSFSSLEPHRSSKIRSPSHESVLWNILDTLKGGSDLTLKVQNIFITYLFP